ncbi:hypothetical protein AHW50_04160 [Salmonella enterica subsp. diarizonae]|uniref:hypothetical protein n=1 Tax=Salmonella enterica TaxID=28901 RepID=UPI0009AE3BF2|nr:hypothetical protein [Salmonella enterica]EDL8429886.1 hypothetical protein [Salmonella enterica subsp. diarizonae]
MKTPYDEPKTKEVNISNFKEQDTLHSKLQSKKKPECKILALSVFVLILLIVAIYEYFALGKQLDNASITFLIVMIFSLAIIIKKIRKIEEYNDGSFFIKTLRAKKLLSKAKRLARWLNTIPLWQRYIIFFTIFIIGYLMMVI